MKKTILLIGFLLLASFVYAEPSQQYNKILLSPLYRESMTQDINYTYTINVNPPDGVSTVESAIINFQLWMNPTVNFYAWVNGETCNTASYQVHTTYANAGEGNIFFDCSNVITSSGTYTITLQPDDNTGAVTGWIDLVYSNRPNADLSVHGTEYIGGESAKMWVQLLDANNTEIDDAVCFAEIYTPNNDELVDDTLMTFVHDGIYVYDFTSPTAGGVYPLIVDCFFSAVQSPQVADASAVNLGSVTSGTVTDTQTDDGTFHSIKETTAGVPKRVDVSYNMTANTTECKDVSELLFSDITIFWNGIWQSSTNDFLTFYIFNYSSSEWIELDNQVDNSPTEQTITNTLSTINVTNSGLLDANNIFQIKINDTDITDAQTNEMDNDYLYVSCDQLANEEWQQVKGSGEMHVSSEDLGIIELTEVGFGDNPEHPEGNINLNFTIFSRVFEGQEAEFEFPLPFDTVCDDINFVRWFNETSGLYEQWNYSDEYEQWHCDADDNEPTLDHLVTDLEIDEDDVQLLEISMENIYARSFQFRNAKQKMILEQVDTVCKPYLYDNGFGGKPILPLEYFPSFNDSLADMCHLTWDAGWHSNRTLHEVEELQFPTSEHDLHILEEHFVGSIHRFDELELHYTILVNDLQIYADYSGFNDTLRWSYWGNKSTIFIVLNTTINDTGAIWSHPDRQLTAFGFDVVNETEITENVWSYNGTIVTNILSQIATDVWAFATRTLSAFGFDVVDEEAQATYVWNDSGRYTHGILLS